MTGMSVTSKECDNCENRMDIDWISWTCPNMGTDECQQTKRLKRTERNKNQQPMPKPAVYYDRSGSRYPETIRLSFEDGHTEIYDRRVEQPSPQQYLNMPNRRRRRK